MKKLALLVPVLAAVALFAQPALADVTHSHEQHTHSAQGETAEPAKEMNDPESMMQESMEKMRAQMAKIKQVKDSKKRRTLLQEHNQSMRDSIKMLREMMGGMGMGCAMMGGGHKMGGHDMGGHDMGGHDMGSHKMDDNPVSQPDSNTDAAPAAQANPDKVVADTGKTSASPEKKLWVCPMHPDVVQDKPGTCPICGMDLVEMEQSGASQAGHSHTMGGEMKGECMMGGGMKGECMKGGGMKGECMMGGGMMGGGMMGGGMMGGGMMGGGMMGGGMKCPMMEMTNKHMGLMLMLMEQMIEHDEAEMATRK